MWVGGLNPEHRPWLLEVVLQKHKNKKLLIFWGAFLCGIAKVIKRQAIFPGVCFHEDFRSFSLPN